MPKTVIDIDEVVRKIALKVIDLATDQDNIPFLSGDLRKSIVSEGVTSQGTGVARVGSSLPYARAVHDGRKALTIYPNVKKNPPYGHRKHKNPVKARLKFDLGGKLVFAKKVSQKARPANPYMQRAIDKLNQEGYDWLMTDLMRTYSAKAVKGILKKITIEIPI